MLICMCMRKYVVWKTLNWNFILSELLWFSKRKSLIRTMCQRVREQWHHNSQVAPLMSMINEYATSFSCSSCVCVWAQIRNCIVLQRTPAIHNSMSI